MKRNILLLIATTFSLIACSLPNHNDNTINIEDENLDAIDSVIVVNNCEKAEVSSEDSICENPDVRAKYDAKDEISFLLKFMNRNIRFPEEAEKKNVDGTVVVQMVVEKDGKPTHFKVIREVDPILDKEALRVAKLLPRFKPAIKDSKPVRSLFNFSVPFRLK